MSEAYNYYAILGLDEAATDDEIREAYRRAARSNHPDLHPHDPQAARRFMLVRQAYEVLGNPAGRAAYRRRGTPTSVGPPHGQPSSDTVFPPAASDPPATSLATELGLAVGAVRGMARRADLHKRVRRRVRQVIRYLERL